MYYILVKDDNSLLPTNEERIIKGSKLVDSLTFLVPPLYKDVHDMSKASVLMEYTLPISRKYETINLILSDERYEGKLLQYIIPFDTNLTCEAGAVELQLTFAYTEMDAQGNIKQELRKTTPVDINIVSPAAWSDLIPDNALSALDQRLIKLDAQMRGLDEYMDALHSNKADSLIYNDKEATLQLSSQGVAIGDKVSVKDMMDEGMPVVDLGGNSFVPDTDDREDGDNVVEI